MNRTLNRVAKKALGLTLFGASLIVGAFSLACASDSDQPLGAEDGGAASEAGFGFDGGPEPDQGTGNADLDDGPPLPLDPNAAPMGMSRECVGMADGCAIDACAQVAHACCTGRADCCGMPELQIFAIDGCTGIDCFPGASPFGSPAASVTGGAFYPHGDGAYDSGLVLPAIYDLRIDRVEVSARFVIPEACPECVDNIESVGIAFVANPPAGIEAHVLPRVALIWARQQIRLVVGSRVVSSWPSVVSGDWHLRVDPDGAVEVTRDGSTIENGRHEHLISPEASLHLVLYGHNENPGANARSATLASLAIGRSECEMTRQWSERTELVLTAGSRTESFEGASSPSSIAVNGRTYLAYVRGGDIFLTSRPDPNLPDRFVWQSAPEAIVTGARSPELAFEDDTFVLYYEQRRTVYRTVITINGASATLSTAEPMERLTEYFDQVFAPTVVATPGVQGAQHVLLARVLGEASGDVPTIAAFSLTAASSSGSVVYHSRLPVADLGDELGDPELFIRNRLYQAYVPYRRGTRWRLAHLVSADLVNWTIADRTALAESGAGELVGPRAPDVTTSPTGIELFYGRHDGVRPTLGRAVRRSPEVANIR